MTERPSAEDHTAVSRLPRVVATIAGVVNLVTGVAAMLAPEAFFDAVATFEPYNRHFVQDIGAFTLGLGSILVLAARPRADALVAALAGAAVGAGAHVVSHLAGLDLGGSPAVDLPLFSVTTAVLAWAAWVRHRDNRAG